MSAQNTAPSTTTHWKNPGITKNNGNDDWSTVQCICIGTGRFLRSVLVPLIANRQGPLSTCLVQPRGRQFMEFMASSTTDGTYPVDTVTETGNVETSRVSIAAAFSWGDENDRAAFYQCLQHQHQQQGNNMTQNLKILGVGLTEAGLASAETPAMQNLFHFIQVLAKIRQSNDQKICIVNTDNVPSNGRVLYQHMMTLARKQQQQKERERIIHFIEHSLAFLDSMVDRIVAEREGSQGLIPRAEPTPAKALVLLDVGADLPSWLTDPGDGGVVVRTSAAQLQADVALKLRIANATHTAVAHVMALSGLLNTTELASNTFLMNYVDDLVQQQIIPACLADPQLMAGVDAPDDIHAVWNDWRRRLTHPTFGASTFFITQNAPAKGGIRFGPTVASLFSSLLSGDDKRPITAGMAYAVAVLLRWLTPTTAPTSDTLIYRGSLAVAPEAAGAQEQDATITYADGLQYNLDQGWYQFKCNCLLDQPSLSQKIQLSDWLYQVASTKPQPVSCVPVIQAYVTSWWDDATAARLPNDNSFVNAVSTLYARLVAGDKPLTLLQEIVDGKENTIFHPAGCQTPCSVMSDGPLSGTYLGRPLQFRFSPIPGDSALLTSEVSLSELESVVTSEVASVPVIDLHTHLLPPQHGSSLCLWGIDELLAYHYLVAEFFITAPACMTPEMFYNDLDKVQQADLIWQALFVDRSPLSEACRGVITTLLMLGLEQQVQARDLKGIRAFYQTFRDDGEKGAQRFTDLVFSKSGVRYTIMTNIPFDSNEAQYWRGPNNRRNDYDSVHYKSAVRVDPLLKGDRQAVEFALKASGYEASLEGARQYLRDWCDTMKPEYVMASTPHDFCLPGDRGTLGSARNKAINPGAMQQPGAFAEAVKAQAGCDGTEDDVPSVINEHSDFLSEVLMKVCQERDLPIALKIGAHRAVNPALGQAGDGVVAFADTSVLSRLCARFPRVRFLATFLSRNNQHEACVLASKFRNLHIYGCWWFCNNPSIIREITQMRVEMLGTAFTCQHSDARVLDQLLYKWSHSRSVISQVLVGEFQKMVASGWHPTREEIRRDVTRLFGGSYGEFMAKSLL